MGTDRSGMTARETALAARGYEIDTVLRLSRVPEERVRDIAREIAAELPEQTDPVAAPKCIFLGGQAGSGKSTWSRRVNAAAGGVYAEIGLDAYRTWHPDYATIEETIRTHWQGRTETPDDTPGNDIADFTHRFAGDVTDMIIESAEQRRLNMILEWGLRTAEEPVRMMEELSTEGYRISVCFIAADVVTSLTACRLRADIMNSYGHIMRRVSDAFHTLAVSMLPDSCGEIYRETMVRHHWCDDFRIVSRTGEILWKNGDDRDPAEFYHTCLHAVKAPEFNDPEEAYRSAGTELRGLHR